MEGRRGRKKGERRGRDRERKREKGRGGRSGGSEDEFGAYLAEGKRHRISPTALHTFYHQAAPRQTQYTPAPQNKGIKQALVRALVMGVGAVEKKRETWPVSEGN